jgi:hypothetical protein
MLLSSEQPHGAGTDPPFAGHIDFMFFRFLWLPDFG